MTTTNLSVLQPDQAQIVAELQAVLGSFTSWKDLLPTSTGQTIIDMLAGIGAYDQYSIEMAYKQCFLDTALTPSAVYAIARSQGVRLPRKIPASMTVSLTRANTVGSLTIPAYSAFSVQSTNLFNRTAIIFADGSPTPVITNVPLYEGQVRTFKLTSNGTDFQMFKTSEINFTVSDQDVLVYANSTQIPVTQIGLWNSSGVQAVNDSTTKDGELLLTFGNAEFGYAPPSTVPLTVVYVVTQGLAGANASLAGLAVDYVGSPLPTIIKGIVGSGGLLGGGDQKTTDAMRKISPLLFSAQNKKATTESEFSGIAASYPGVLDALVVGQHKLSPSDPRYMNLARVSLLTPTPFTDIQWNDFLTWYKQRVIYPLRFYRVDPVPRTVGVQANIYCQTRSDLPTVQANVLASLKDLFSPRVGSIGFNMYRSDVYEAIKNSDPNIVYVELLTPATDIIVDITSPPFLSATVVAGGGQFTAGHYTYGVSGLSSTGESLVTNFTSVTITDAQAGAGVSVRLAWTALTNVTGYNVYGRDEINPGFLDTVGPNTTTYIDDAAFAPSTPLPPLDSSGVHYALLDTTTPGVTNLNMMYTQRGAL